MERNDFAINARAESHCSAHKLIHYIVWIHSHESFSCSIEELAVRHSLNLVYGLFIETELLYYGIAKLSCIFLAAHFYHRTALDNASMEETLGARSGKEYVHLAATA